MFLFYILILLMAVVRHPLLTPILGEDTMFKYLGAACVAYAGLHLFLRGTIPSILRSWQMRFFFILYGWALASYFFVSMNHQPALSYTSMALLLLIAMTVVDTEARLRGTMIAAIASLTFASAYVIRQWQVYHTIYVGIRAAGITGDANYFSASALVSLAIAYYLSSPRESRLVRLFSFGSLLMILLALMFAASRGAMIGLAIAAVFVAFRSNKRMVALFAIAILLGAFLLLAPNSPLDRFLHPGYGDDLAVDARKLAWTAGIRMIQAHPLVGVGLGNFKPAMPFYSDPGVTITEIAHNTYIEIAAELGIPALLLFLAMLAATFFSLQKVRRRALAGGMDFLYRSAGAMQAGLIGFSVAAFVLSAEYQKLFWLLLGISAALPQLVDAHVSEAPDSRSSESEPESLAEAVHQ